MYSIRETRWRWGVLCAVVLLMGTISTASAQTEEATSVAEELAGALRHYTNLEFDQGITTARSLLSRADLTAQDSVAIYEVLSILTYAKGEEFLQKALGYLQKISHVGPCVIHLPRELWPAELRDKWYGILKANDQLICPDNSQSNVKTIAIMEFDNFSIGKYAEELASLGKGLADFFQHDFAKISTMRVVERDKIDYLLDELKLQQSGAVDQATAVKAGKMLGAQFIVFGSITQLDKNNTRVLVRVVSVETSEIIASVDKEGKPDYCKIEKGLVEELAKALEVDVSDDEKELIKKGGTDSYDATNYYAKGLEYMDRYDYSKAYEFFKKAYELDPEFAEAKRKMEIYEPLAA